MRGSRRVVRPGMDELVEFCARALRLPHVAVPLEGVGGADVTVAQATRNEMLDCVQSRVIWHAAGEIADDADACVHKTVKTRQK